MILPIVHISATIATTDADLTETILKRVRDGLDAACAHTALDTHEEKLDALGMDATVIARRHEGYLETADAHELLSDLHRLATETTEIAKVSASLESHAEYGSSYLRLDPDGTVTIEGTVKIQIHTDGEVNESIVDRAIAELGPTLSRKIAERMSKGST